MAGTVPDQTAWDEAIAGFQEFSERFTQLAEVEEDPVDGIVRYLRSIPAEDMVKKQELAAFFKSEAGSQYTKAERKAAYDALLGEGRNAELRG